MVDEVVVDFSSNKLEVWDRVRFDVLFKGDDWRGTAKGDKLEADMATVGVKVCYFPYTVHTSSTLLRSILTERSASYTCLLPSLRRVQGLRDCALRARLSPLNMGANCTLTLAESGATVAERETAETPEFLAYVDGQRVGDIRRASIRRGSS